MRAQNGGLSDPGVVSRMASQNPLTRRGNGEDQVKWIARVASVRKVAFLVALLVAGVSVVATAESAKNVQDTSGVIYAGVTHVEGSDIYVSGDFKDEILGRGAIVYLTKVQSGPQPASILIKARKVTIYTKHGTLTGKGQATENLTDNTVTDGTFKLDKGTGDYKGHQLKGTFEGNFADGVYTFNYDAKYR